LAWSRLTGATNWSTLENSGFDNVPIWGIIPRVIQTTPPPINLIGDINSDGTVNSLDWSIMSSQWFTSNTQSDLNTDGIVNSIDFSLMNGNWGQSN